jgi:hypothetical protein
VKKASWLSPRCQVFKRTLTVRWYQQEARCDLKTASRLLQFIHEIADLPDPPDAALLHMEERKKQGLRPGGFGILIAKHVVDEVIYGESGNDVILIKYLDGRSHSPEPQDSRAKGPAR